MLSHGLFVERSSSEFWRDGRAAFALCPAFPRTPSRKMEVSAADVVLFTPTFGACTPTKSGLELLLTPADKSE